MSQLALDLVDDAPIKLVVENIVTVIKPHLIFGGTYAAVCVAYSGGKDSSVLLALTLEAARQARSEGCQLVPVVVMNSDTTIENPLVSSLVRAERENIRSFAETHGLDVHFVTGKPPLNARWAVKVIAANGLPPIPGGKSACTIDWKIQPLTRAVNQWKKENGVEGQVLKLTGTRFSESNERGRKMSLRGESSSRVLANEKGEFILSPIADLDTDQVWDVIGLLRSQEGFPSYTDFDDLLGVYSKAGGSSCPLVADYRMNGATIASCGSRTGCSLCTKIESDESLMNMLDDHPEFKPLYALREFVAAILFDFDKRVWIGRTIDSHGYITIQPDALSPEVCLDLLRYALTIDADENEAARTLPGGRRFEELVPLEALVLIDFYHALYGLTERPYEAWRIWFDVHQQGNRYYPPEIEKVPRTPMPEPRYLFAGDGWFGYQRDYTWAGLRDPIAEAFEQDTGAEYALRELNDGRVILDLPRADVADVDLLSESFWLAFDFMLPEWIADAPQGLGHSAAVIRYLEFGMVNYSDHGLLDSMCRRAEWRNQHGLSRRESLESIMDRTISRQEYLKKTGQAADTNQITMDLSVADAA